MSFNNKRIKLNIYDFYTHFGDNILNQVWFQVLLYKSHNLTLVIYLQSKLVLFNPLIRQFQFGWFGLAWFYGISTIRGYLMQNPF